MTKEEAIVLLVGTLRSGGWDGAEKEASLLLEVAAENGGITYRGLHIGSVAAPPPSLSPFPTTMKVITDHPVALNSPDHIFPWGTKRDNTTDVGFIEEIEDYFGRRNKIKALDIGCSGGQLTIDFCMRGHDAIGIEGSDYSAKNFRANWPSYYNNKLFTCDATKPYRVACAENSEKTYFDLITAWEVIEHIKEEDLDCFFGNITTHMKEDSIFCGSISVIEDVIEGHTLHQTVQPEEVWRSEILPKYFSTVEEFPFKNKVRGGDNFHVLLKI
tara:strand:+ start:1458 stop:2273 length:816 start_codon:yes stop_codon:yes gene_type:complete